MSFKDLAKVEGYNLDAMEAELKAAKERIAELEAERERLKKDNESLNQRHATVIDAYLDMYSRMRDVHRDLKVWIARLRNR